MATIDLRRTHALAPDDARAKAEELARAMEAKLGIVWRWDGDQIVRFDAPSGAAKGSKGQVTLTADSVRVEIDLPFLLRALRGVVEGKVRARLDALLGPE
ncbi:MAG: polyhydroxyalkanoic acid system family protein [Polyangiaceae bacterium]|nr:polyhydroxyalkanoic acid system family protein [Polyangiaceae bacterium]